MNFTRVLIANRGEIARRLIRQYREAGVETVSVFSEPDMEQPYVEEADYSAYLNGRTVLETYLDPSRMVAVAMDAGCDAIHPGYCFLAERVEFAEMAMMANLAVIGAEPRALARAVDRFHVRQLASELGIPLIPASDPLPADSDGLSEAAQLGTPLFVKTAAGGPLRRVEHLEAVPEAVAWVRAEAMRWNGDSTVYLERAVDKLRRLGTVVASDRAHGVALGTTDGSVEMEGRSWMEEIGDSLVEPDLLQRLNAAAAELVHRLGWVGVARVRWAITPNGGWYLLGVSARLTTGYTLCEQVLGIDLVDLQLRLTYGDPLGFDQRDVSLARHGLQIRVLAVDPARPRQPVDGVIERLELPQGEHIVAEAGTAEGLPCTPDSDPLIAKITVTAPTRQAALVRARAALEQTIIEGVPTNREVLLALLADAEVWQGRVDVQTLPMRLGIDLAR